MTMTTYTYDERIVSDLYKEVYGFRPTSWWFQEWKAADEDAKQAIWDGLCEAHEAEMAYQRERDERAGACAERRAEGAPESHQEPSGAQQRREARPRSQRR